MAHTCILKTYVLSAKTSCKYAKLHKFIKIHYLRSEYALEDDNRADRRPQSIFG